MLRLFPCVAVLTRRQNEQHHKDNRQRYASWSPRKRCALHYLIWFILAAFTIQSIPTLAYPPVFAAAVLRVPLHVSKLWFSKEAVAVTRFVQ